MQELAPGIFLLTITLKDIAPYSVNCYLVQDKEGFAIIDSGWDIPAAVESLEAQLAEAGAKFSDVMKVILTHAHSDHLGMMRRLKELNNATVYMHRNERDFIKMRYTRANDYWPNTDRFLKTNGMPDTDLAPFNTDSANPRLTEPDIWLEGGETITIGEYALKVINTPGHTPGHIALFESRHKLLFSGDVLLPTVVTNAAGHIQHMELPLRKYLDSLRRLNEMEIERVLPGHEYVFSDHRTRIAQIQEHYRQRYAAVAAIMNGTRDPVTAHGIAKQLTWTPRVRTVPWEKLGAIDKRFALLQTIAILEENAFDGKIARLSQNDKIYFQAKVKPNNPK